MHRFLLIFQLLHRKLEGSTVNLIEWSCYSFGDVDNIQ